MRGSGRIYLVCALFQARAPNSPVIIVGTHLDKLNRSGKHEMNRCLEHIYEHYGSTMARKEGFPQVSEGRGEGQGLSMGVAADHGEFGGELYQWTQHRGTQGHHI